MTAVMLVVLLGLGTWQVQRLAWKEAILAQIAQAEAAPPIPLPAGPMPSRCRGAYDPGAVHQGRGHRHAAARLSALYGAEVRDTRAGPELGAHLIEPLQREGAPPCWSIAAGCRSSVPRPVADAARAP